MVELLEIWRSICCCCSTKQKELEVKTEVQLRPRAESSIHVSGETFRPKTETEENNC